MKVQITVDLERLKEVLRAAIEVREDLVAELKAKHQVGEDVSALPRDARRRYERDLQPATDLGNALSAIDVDAILGTGSGI